MFLPMTRLMGLNKFYVMGLLLIVASCATTVDITGRYPAGVQDAAAIKKVSMIGFSGQDAEAFSSAFLDMLTNATFDGQRYFTVVHDTSSQQPPVTSSSAAASFGRSVGAEGVYYGKVLDISANNDRYETESQVCSSWNKKKCVRYTRVKNYCLRRTLNMTADIKLVQSENRQVIYSKNSQGSASAGACSRTYWSRDSLPEGDVVLVAQARRQLLDKVRRDIAPYNQAMKATILDKSKGLPPAQAAKFKLATQFAKAGNMAGACKAWNEIAKHSPNHPYVIYSQGVCFEVNGDFENAARMYQRALESGAGADKDVVAALSRSERLAGSSKTITRAQQSIQKNQDRKKAQAAKKKAAKIRRAKQAAAKAKKELAETRKKAQDASNMRNQLLIAKHGNEMAQKILSHKVEIGMTPEQVRESKGKPTEQQVIPPSDALWEFPDITVVFTDGKVTYVNQK